MPALTCPETRGSRSALPTCTASAEPARKRSWRRPGINPDTRVRDLTDEEEARIRECIDKDYIVEGDLRRQVALNVKNLTEIGCYRGLRHRKGLPVRGQRSKTNARTRKGPKRIIANKKK